MIGVEKGQQDENIKLVTMKTEELVEVTASEK